MKHTPGTWEVHTDGSYPSLVGVWNQSEIPDDLKCVAICDVTESGCDMDETLSNAKLIASAPDLLRACEWAAKFFKIYADDWGMPEDAHLIYDAITKYKDER